MKIFKRILIILLVVLLLAQIPFIYRRYQTGKLAEKIASLDAQRTTYQDPNFKEYKGIIHAHTNLGGHSTGSFDELIAAANANDLDFVLMTEHFSETFDTAEKTLNGVYGKTLFVGGNEIDTSDGDRFLLIPGGGEAARWRMSGTAAFLKAAHLSNQLALIAYPEKFKSWDSNFDGVEVFNLHTAAKQMNWLTALGDLIWSYPSYPELTFAKNFQRPDANLAKFDEIASQQALLNCLSGAPGCRLVLSAGADAHSDLGLHLIGSDGGQKLINIKLDPYETIFRIARIHVWLPVGTELYPESLISAIRQGDFFIGLDALGDTTGFVFRKQFAAYPIDNPQHVDSFTSFEAKAPFKARFVFFRNGEKVAERPDSATAELRDPRLGVYRVEVYRDDLGPPFDKMPWIISNPIYVR